MKTTGCFVLLVWILSAVSAAEASDLTLFGGVQHQGELTLSTAVQSGTRNLSFDPRNFGVFGLRFSHGRVIGLEHTLAYNPNFIESQTKAIIYNSDLLVQAPLSVFRPYGTVGLGAFFTAGDGLADFGSKFAVNYGGGLKIVPGPVGARIDVRGYTLPSIGDQTLNIIEVTLGVVFSF